MRGGTGKCNASLRNIIQIVTPWKTEGWNPKLDTCMLYKEVSFSHSGARFKFYVFFFGVYKKTQLHIDRVIGAHPTISLIERGFTHRGLVYPIILDLCAARSKTCHHPPLFPAQDTCRCNLFTSKLRAKPLSFITPVSNSSWVSKFQAKFSHKSQGVWPRNSCSKCVRNDRESWWSRIGGNFDELSVCAKQSGRIES